eukprot:jgi/Galph1/4052/GphlegSOOS_G2733.1
MTTEHTQAVAEKVLLTPEERLEKIETLEAKKEELSRKLRPVSQPNREELEAAVSSQRAIIDAALAKKEQKKQLQKQKYQRLEETKPEFLAVKAVYDEKVSELRRLKEERRQIVAKIQELRKLIGEGASSNKANISTGNQALDEKLKNLKNVEQLEKYINTLERRQTVESLSLNEEKKIISEISLLRNKGKTSLQNLEKSEQDRRKFLEEKRKELEQLLGERKLLEAKIEAAGKEIEKSKQSKDDIRAKQEATIAKITEELTEVHLDDLQKQIDIANDEIRRLRHNFNQKLNEWYEYKRQAADLDRLVRQIRYERRQYQRDLRRVEREKVRLLTFVPSHTYWREFVKELAEYGPPSPYEEEKNLCDNLIQYLSRLCKIEAEEKKEAQKDSQSLELDGIKLIGKNATLFEGDPTAVSASVSGVNTSRNKSKKAKRKGSSKEGTDALNENDKLPPHSMEHFLAFQRLNIQPPIYVKEVKETLDHLQKKKEYYENASEESEENVVDEVTTSNGNNANHVDSGSFSQSRGSKNGFVGSSEDFPEGLPISSHKKSYITEPGSSKLSFAQVMQVATAQVAVENEEESETMST